MPDDVNLLGTSGKESVPYEYQMEAQQLARRRQMAQLMMQRGLQQPAPTQMFGRYAARQGAVPALTNALSLFLGNKDMGMADTAQAAMGQRMQTAKAEDLRGVQSLAQGTPGTPGVPRPDPQQILDGGDTAPTMTAPDAIQPVPGVPGDPRAAIALAMQSPWGSTQNYGTGLQKTEDTKQAAIVKAMMEMNPGAAAHYAQENNPQAKIPDFPLNEPEFGTAPNGTQMVVTRDNKGQPTVKWEPPKTTVSVDARQGNDLNSERAKYFIEGGKGHDLGVKTTQQLSNNESILTTLEKNPGMGAGAEAMQWMRKWAQTLGAPASDLTTPTEMAKMQLGQLVLNRLGGLGAQVSDADRKFMMETQGSIGNDPEAVRRMILLETKYLMQVQSKLNDGARGLASYLPNNTALPVHNFNIRLNQRNADDMEQLMMGKGFQALPAPSAPAAMPPSFRRRQ